MQALLDTLSGWAWGPVTITLLVGSGIFMTLLVGMIQLRRFCYAWKLISGRYDNPQDQGEITHFQALSAALSATIGTGNIAGVGTAVALGGPGAVFWMWVTAVFGMALKYAECLLSLHFRTVHEDGSVSAGPMYYLERGLGCKWLGLSFAFFATVASFGIGNMAQANSVAEPLQSYFAIPKPVTGLVIAVLVFAVIVGGIRRIGGVAARRGDRSASNGRHSSHRRSGQQVGSLHVPILYSGSSAGHRQKPAMASRSFGSDFPQLLQRQRRCRRLCRSDTGPGDPVWGGPRGFLQ